MMNKDPYFRLPDPATQAGFYQDVVFKRLVAFFIDLLMIFCLCLVLSLATFGLGLLIFFLMFSVVGFLYRVVTLSQGSATWGMRLMGIELRRLDGGRLSGTDSLLHTIAFYVSFGIFPLQAISIAMMVVTARGQGLTDMLFGTVAVNKRASS